MAFCALHVKEGALLLLNRLKALDSGKDGITPWRNAHRAASHHHLGIATRDGLLAEMKEFGPGLNGGPETEIPLHEAGEGRKGNDGIGWEVMWMEAEKVKKLAEEIAGRKAESPLEVGQEDDPFAGFRGRDGFCAGSATDYLRSDSARPDQPVDVSLADI